ncbi:DUF2637 domain-containing protein [Streptomyces sp. SID5473]|uniref:DUF2637 domain-containing protein n=2 Tax=Streptomyces tsukubensis TaxID=83656 RepID=A0A7G3UM12_STRT9|nr:hypothetical protein B7R87_26865 [Streptomyces tsukubensis]MYS66470.1 DUF2637 domain-containing protein [Streptomyces sp. SID5473]QKM71427.1 DUF2637 domain-containing protein [Streptomyces tsukubensis NRRL18488]TAI41613.1 DUF2637 domain-containing protein [Streptomyces tsukubensis]
MSRQSAEQWTLVTAGVVIIALTGAAFWLSYAHLAEVAGQHGLGHSPARQWAWPATLDAAIVAGELLMLRAGLRKEVDWWAIALTAAGSVGSIALNIAGVSSTGNGGSVPVLDYVVAAVPPTAALVAFGVLMRQIHRLVAHPGDHIETPAVAPAPAVMLAMATDTHGALEQRTNTAMGPDHSTGPDDWPRVADQTSSSATDQSNTADADHAPTGADHHPAPVPERTNPADQPGADQDRKAADQPNAGPDHQRTTDADQTEVVDQPGADHGTGTLRASITAGQAADQPADHERTTQPAPPGPSVGGGADHRVSRSSRHRSAADHRPDQTDHTPADQPPAGQDRKAADQPNTGPDHQRTTAADQTVIVRERPRTTIADQGEDEPVPMERLVELARTAALTEGRMTRRVIRPYLRAQSIQISNERFAELQTRLYQDPALAHLPRSQRKTR